jgi:cyclophilin family peptidyl-prolyl cis-trans isomerase/HEAT repeat protein
VFRRSARAAALGSAAVAWFACGASAQGTATPDGAEVRLAARLLRMADTRTLDTALVDEALAAQIRSIRAQAALAIGQVAGRARIGRLRTLIADPDTAVAANAAFALGLLKDSASVAVLGTALRSPAGVGAAAAWALGEIGAASRGVIEAALGGTNVAPATTSAILLAAAKLRPVPSPLIARHLAASNHEVRWSAAYAIARPRARDGLRALLPLAADTAADVRALVAGALSKAATGDSLGEPARKILRTLAADRDHLVRTNAVRTLAAYGPAERDVVLATLHDADVNVRVAAAQAAGPALDTARADWERLFAGDSTFMVRRSLLDAAARNGVALTAIAPWASNSDWRLRAAAASAAIAAAPAARRIDVARPLLDDEDGRVRVAAIDAVAPLADSAIAGVDARAFLAGQLADRDVYARAAIISALGRHPRVDEVGRMLQAYREAFEDDDNDARIAALRFVAASWQRDSAAWRAADVVSLRALPVATDPLESAEVRDVGPLAAWRGLAPKAKDLAWYDSVVRAIVLPTRAGHAPRAKIVTERGELVVTLHGADAPLTVKNFIDLARKGYYRDTRFHRVVPNFVAQDGDPRGDGNGGPGYAIRDEFNRRRYDRGAVGMALSGPDTGGSQYFLAHAPQPHLDGHYTVFGHLTSGDGVLDRIVQGDRIVDIQVVP